ncbi:MAG: exodeoxyribonuclease VII large subunit [Rickettsiales bacterium]|nr:exodeoxyribonuclease VII large subunit [Rickettsiales bacterium]
MKRLVEDAFGYVRIRGEVSGFKKAASGHCYFSLKDQDSVISSVLFRGAAMKVDFEIEEGLEIIVSGKVTTYSGRSNYQIIVERVEIAGIGAILEMIETRRKKLLEEGIFDEKHKKSLPFFPRKIAVITSKTGAVIEDIKHRINDRCPLHLILYPVSVQGKSASSEIISAIKYFDSLEKKPEVLIIARGGGSIEDLMPFNDEELIRAVFACAIPIISAVGHETDTTLIDYVSDFRAPTPTAAAEIATPVIEDLRKNIHYFAGKLKNIPQEIILEYRKKLESIEKFIQSPKQILDSVAERLNIYAKKFDLSVINFFESKVKMLLEIKFDNEKILNRIELSRQKIQFLDEKIIVFIKRGVEDCQVNLGNLSKILQHSSYDKILKRGFALIKDKNNNLVSSTSSVSNGDEVSIQLSDGSLGAKVINTK